MLTPAGCIVRANPEHTCAGCGRDLVNVTRYPGPIRFRCHNRACAQCELPPAPLPWLLRDRLTEQAADAIVVTHW